LLLIQCVALNLQWLHWPQARSYWTVPVLAKTKTICSAIRYKRQSLCSSGTLTGTDKICCMTCQRGSAASHTRSGLFKVADKRPQGDGHRLLLEASPGADPRSSCSSNGPWTGSGRRDGVQPLMSAGAHDWGALTRPKYSVYCSG
jgi:hypothetical protein